MHEPLPSFEEDSREETSRVQQLSSVAPPPLPSASAETTEPMPTFVEPAPNESQALRTLGWVMVIGGSVVLALVLVSAKLRSAPAAQELPTPAPLAVAAAPLQTQEAPATKSEPAQSTTKARRTKRAASAGPAVDANVTIRIRARVAPVRAAPEPDANVVCSVKRGAVMRSLQQAPSSKARWFAVQCDKDSTGWVHENFVTVQP